jgi:hypothetical protein
VLVPRHGFGRIRCGAAQCAVDDADESPHVQQWRGLLYGRRFAN